MCVASILWSGFTKIYYWLPYETTTAQGIPHDVNTMHELWGVESYRKVNKYFASASLLKLIDELPDTDLDAKASLVAKSNKLLEMYNSMSDQYHKEKFDNKNNTLVLG